MKTLVKKPVDTRNLLATVLAYQNPDVVARIQSQLELTLQEAQLLFDDVKRFLYLGATREGQFSPPPKVDKGWHEFLMFTRDYAVFCRHYFGHFIHHEPHRINDIPSSGGQINKTALAAQKIFGKLSPNWDHPKMSECDNSDCFTDDGHDGTCVRYCKSSDDDK